MYHLQPTVKYILLIPTNRPRKEADWRGSLYPRQETDFLILLQIRSFGHVHINDIMKSVGRSAISIGGQAGAHHKPREQHVKLQ